MSLPDDKFPLASFVHEEMIDTLSVNLAQFLVLIPPVARLRLLAFMHLVEQPGTMKATLDVQASGSLRLTLDTMVAPCRAH
jgi:hypothetical protein